MTTAELRRVRPLTSVRGLPCHTTNLFKLSPDAINAMDKRDLVSKTEKLKRKVLWLTIILKSFVIKYLSENLSKLIELNEELSRQFIVMKKVNTLLEKPVTELEKSQAKAK